MSWIYRRILCPLGLHDRALALRPNDFGTEPAYRWRYVCRECRKWLAP